MILLLHLTGCPDLVKERELHSEALLEQIFKLVGNRWRDGQIVSSSVDVAPPRGSSKKASLIYCLLAKLRYRTWQRAGWGTAACGECALRDLADCIKLTLPELQCQLQAKPPQRDEPESLEESAADVIATSREEAADINFHDDFLEQFLLPNTSS